jgi:hypothetical protein
MFQKLSAGGCLEALPRSDFFNLKFLPCRYNRLSKRMLSARPFKMIFSSLARAVSYWLVRIRSGFKTVAFWALSPTRTQ